MRREYRQSEIIGGRNYESGLRRLEANELWLKGDPPKRFRNLKICFAQTEMVFGKDSPAVGLVLFGLASFTAKRGDFERALPYHREKSQARESIARQC